MNKKSKIKKDTDILAEYLSAEQDALIDQLTLFIPDKDKNGKKIKDITYWKKEALRVLTMLGRGATANAAADGTWMEDEEYDEGKIIWEKTIVMYTFVIPSLLYKNINELKIYLHRFGKETNQGEVAYIYNRELFKIKEFD